MSNNAHVLSVEQMYKLLLWTPWDERMVDGLPDWLKENLKKNEHYFMSKCFVRPKPFASSKSSVYAELKNRLKDSDNKAIVLTAYSGAGKSTLLRAALRELNLSEDAIVLDMIDNIALPKKGVDWEGWFVEHCEKNPRPLTKKIITVLLFNIYKILHISPPLPQCDESKINDHLRTILTNYLQYYSEYKNDYLGLIRIIRDYVDGTLVYQRDIKDILNINAQDCYVACIEKELFRLFAKEETWPMRCVQGLLEVLSFLLLCEKQSPTETKRVIAFDNIEHFLDNGVLHDEEIHDFLDIINGHGTEDGFIKQRNAEYKHPPMSGLSELNNKQHVYSERVPIVLAIREVSVVMQREGRADAIDTASEDYIVLRDELDFAEIIRRKYVFLRDKSDELGLSSDFFKYAPFNFIFKILQDDGEKGVAKRLELLHSYNKRRTLRGLLEACYAADTRTHSTILRTGPIGDYYHLYGKLRSIPNDDVRGACFNGMRQMIIRMWFDSVGSNRRPEIHGMNENYFEKLGLGRASSQQGSARQILLFISRHPLIDESQVNQVATVSLSHLMEQIFIHPRLHGAPNALKDFASKKEGRDKIKDMAKKLNYMRKRNKECYVS